MCACCGVIYGYTVKESYVNSLHANHSLCEIIGTESTSLIELKRIQIFFGFYCLSAVFYGRLRPASLFRLLCVWHLDVINKNISHIKFMKL